MTTLQQIQATGVSPIAYKVITETNNQGEAIDTIHIVTGSPISGYYRNTIIGGKLGTYLGTPSSGYRKPYRRLPASIINSYTWINS